MRDTALEQMMEILRLPERVVDSHSDDEAKYLHCTIYCTILALATSFQASDEKTKAQVTPGLEGGERGIRTPGRLTTDSRFQDGRIQPLCHLSRSGSQYSTLCRVVASLSYSAFSK
jgi:hypothetical protein